MVVFIESTDCKTCGQNVKRWDRRDDPSLAALHVSEGIDVNPDTWLPSCQDNVRRVHRGLVLRHRKAHRGEVETGE